MLAPAPLCENHVVADFDCGVESLNAWLRDYGLWNQTNGYTRTFVVCNADTGGIVGYYALASGMIARSEVPRAMTQQGAPSEIPIALLARLAVHNEYQGRGLGRSLLQNALVNIISAAQNVAFRAVIVDALDEGKSAFYRKYGFRETKIHKLKLMLPIQHAIASRREATR